MKKCKTNEWNFIHFEKLLILLNFALSICLDKIFLSRTKRNSWDKKCFLSKTKVLSMASKTFLLLRNSFDAMTKFLSLTKLFCLHQIWFCCADGQGIRSQNSPSTLFLATIIILVNNNNITAQRVWWPLLFRSVGWVHCKDLHPNYDFTWKRCSLDFRTTMSDILVFVVLFTDRKF